MDALYKVYAKIRLDQLTDLDKKDNGDRESNPTSSDHILETNDNILYLTIERMIPNGTEDDVQKNHKISKRYLDISSAVGLASFLYRGAFKNCTNEFDGELWSVSQ